MQGRFCSHPWGCWLPLAKSRQERGQRPGDIKAPEAVVTAASSARLIPASAAGMSAAQRGTRRQPLAAATHRADCGQHSVPLGSLLGMLPIGRSWMVTTRSWGCLVLGTQSKSGARSSGARHLGWGRWDKAAWFEQLHVPHLQTRRAGCEDIPPLRGPQKQRPMLTAE